MVRMRAKYENEVRSALMEKFGYKSPMQIPKFDKIVINIGVGEAKDNGRIIDCTSGRRTKSIIITDSDHVILSALATDVVAQRLNGVETDDNGGIRDE